MKFNIHYEREREDDIVTKLEKETKSEIDKEMKVVNYISMKIGIKILFVIIILVVLGGVGKVVYTKTIGKEQKNAEREVFKSSTAYTEQAASYLAKAYKEYNEADNDVDKMAIMEYVIVRYPNLNTESIDNSKLRAFYEECLQ